jgi:alpha-L-fucosidase
LTFSCREENIELLPTLLALGCLLAVSASDRPSPPAPIEPVPSARHIAWHEMEYYAFIHFNMNTFTGREWGEGYEDAKQFNPTALDCRQWARVAKEAGMKGIIITAKHHDGFCLWPSQYTEHSVKNSPFRNGKGDVLKELSEACKQFGLKFGVYLSPWDRNHPQYGSPAYNEFFKKQLTEVLTHYGPIFEVWFDGANGEGPNGRRQVYDWPGFIETVRMHQQNAVMFSDAGPDIRWVGNESGFAGETNWAMLRRDEFYPGTPNTKDLPTGQENGTHWVPAECDVSIRPGWFYHAEEDGRVKTVKQLMEIYYRSVGQNGSLLLNLPVDRRGLVHENDVAALMAFRKAREAAFAKDLARSRPVMATETREGRDYSATNLVDGSPKTYWAARDGATDASIEVDLGADQPVNRVLLQEAIALGQRVEAYSIETFANGAWQKVFEGTTIGHKRIARFSTVTASRIRVHIKRARACPAITTLSVYHTPEP